MEPSQYNNRCDFCETVFVSKRKLQHHLQTTHMNKSTISCNLCTKTFARFDGLGTHIEMVHRKLRNFKCEHCTKSFATSQRVRRHILSVHEKMKPFKCITCSSTFSDKGNLLQHERTVHSQLKVKCDSCGAILKNMLTLKDHMKRIHEMKEKNFECKVCHKRFATNGYLRDHTNLVHDGVKKYACMHCDKKYGWKTHLLKHIKMVHLKTNTSYNCDICIKTYGRKEHLNRHVREIHQKQEKIMHQCNQCNETFKNRIALKDHSSLLHDNVKCYKCSICDEEFGWHDRYRYHLKKHSSVEESSKCDQCIKTFPNMYLLKKHIAKAHVGEKAKPQKSEVFECDICNKSFASRKQFMVHDRRQHKPPRKTEKSKCDICDKIFNSRISMMTHIRMRHLKGHVGAKQTIEIGSSEMTETQNYKCGICEKTFGSKDHLAQHLFKHKNSKS